MSGFTIFITVMIIAFTDVVAILWFYYENFEHIFTKAIAFLMVVCYILFTGFCIFYIG